MRCVMPASTSTLKRLSQPDEVAKLRVGLKAATEKIQVIERELKKQGDHSSQEVSDNN